MFNITLCLLFIVIHNLETIKSKRGNKEKRFLEIKKKGIINTIKRNKIIVKNKNGWTENPA